MNISTDTEPMKDLDLAFHEAGPDSGDVFVVETRARAGMTLQSHQHKHGHLSVLVSGTARVRIGRESQEMTGYRMITIPANVDHEITAITDVIWLCLWAGDIAPRQEAEDSLKLVGNYGLPLAG